MTRANTLGLHDVAACRAAFHLRRPNAVEMTLRRLASWGEILAQAKKAERPRIEQAVTALRDLIAEEAGKRLPRPDEFGPTPELMAQVRLGKGGDPVARLYALGHLDDDQVRAAVEIGAIVRHVVAGIGPATMRWQAASESPDDGAGARASSLTKSEHMALMGLLHAFVYLPWARTVRHRAMILALIVDGESIEDLRWRYRMRWKSALGAICAALDLYNRIKGERRPYLTFDEIEAATVAEGRSEARPARRAARSGSARSSGGRSRPASRFH